MLYFLYQYDGGLISTKRWIKNFTSARITFDQQVTITEYRYPIFSFTNFFAELGGSIGLWLGMGLLQIGIYLGDLLARAWLKT